MTSPQSSTSITAVESLGSSSGNTMTSDIRATKRKLDDAFQVLDSAVGRSHSTERLSPPKKIHRIRSLYSTLAKYGIGSKDDATRYSTDGHIVNLSNKTPHLTAILTRAATRTRKALPFKFSSSSNPAQALPPTAEYRPSSIPAFLSRLSTFKLATYANKPPAIDAVAAAKCGWINDGKDRLVCGLCNNSWVVAGREGLNRDAANALVEKQRVSLVEMHKDGCPWKTRQCDSSIYRIPLQAPAVMVRDMKHTAIALDPILRDVEIKHPLMSTQLNSLRSTISSYSLSSHAIPMDPDPQNSDINMSPSLESSLQPSDTAILTSLFGWILVVPAPPEQHCRPSSRITSVASSTPQTPSITRATSFTYQTAPLTPSSRQATPTPFTFRMASGLLAKHDSSLLQCTLCQRRIGLWAFAPQPSGDVSGPSTPQNGTGGGASVANSFALVTPSPPPPPTKKTTRQRQFDLLKEHRSYCPYVVRSTVLPSLPVPPTNPATATNGHTRSNSSVSQINGQNNSAIEGWRAILTVVLRYGVGQRQRVGLDFGFQESNDGEAQDDEPIEVDKVKAMVTGVKSRGGKELLRYVKGLLG